MDLKLDNNGDLALDGDTLGVVIGGGEVLQRVGFALGLFAGEYGLDTGFGIDWRGEVLVRDPDLTALRARLVAFVGGLAGVRRVVELGLELVGEARSLRVALVLEASDGAQVEGVLGVEAPGSAGGWMVGWL